jgi:hypothetical protein
VFFAVSFGFFCLLGTSCIPRGGKARLTLSSFECLGALGFIVWWILDLRAFWVVWVMGVPGCLVCFLLLVRSLLCILLAYLGTPYAFLINYITYQK